MVFIAIIALETVVKVPSLELSHACGIETKRMQTTAMVWAVLLETRVFSSSTCLIVRIIAVARVPTRVIIATRVEGIETSRIEDNS